MRKKSTISRAKPHRGGKRERTRARLIEAATQLIGEKGYERTTLEEVAAQAGVTRGAIYGNFKNREDLFLAVVETRWKPVIPPLRHGATLKQQMRILGEAVVAAAPGRQAQAVGAASFQAYALTHGEMRKRLHKWNAEIYRGAAAELRKFVPEKELPMPADEFVRILHALTDGLLFLRFLTPDLMTDKIIVAAFEALA